MRLTLFDGKFVQELTFHQTNSFPQTRNSCLVHLSQISSNNFFFITALSAKHKRWSVKNIRMFEKLKNNNK